MWTGIALMAALALATTAGAQQQGRGGAPTVRVQCPGCDSAQLAAARLRAVDTEIAELTIEVARTKMMYENLRSRLAPDSPEPPRSASEREELQARLATEARQLELLLRRLAARCGEQAPVRGYLGLSVNEPGLTEVTGSRSTTVIGYPVVQEVAPESPAARAGVAVDDTILAINRSDVRGRSFDQFVREPGQRLVMTLVRDGVRRNVTITVGSRPPSFGGACLEHRDLRIADVAGQTVITMRRPGAGAIGVSGQMGGSGSGGPGRSSAGPTRVIVSGATPASGMPIDTSRVGSFIMLTPMAEALFLSRGASGAIVAGAEVFLLSGNLKATFAADHGALVLNVAPRSPAQQSGMVEGDVIVRVNGEAVTAIRILQREIHEGHEKRSVSLDILREKQPKKITLRW